MYLKNIIIMFEKLQKAAFVNKCLELRNFNALNML